MKLALVSSFITTFFLRLLSCFLSFVRSLVLAPLLYHQGRIANTHIRIYTILTHTDRETLVFACLRCVIIFFVGSTPIPLTFPPIPFIVCLFRIFALLWIFSVFCLSEYVYSIFVYIAVDAFIYEIFSEIAGDEQA